MQIQTGATVAMTRQLLEEIGPLDERYFNYNEDVDHCLRAAHAGYTNYCCSESIAYHWVSQSGPARFSKTRESDAVFWTEWGHRFEVDLPIYVSEGLSYILAQHPQLGDFQFDPLNLCRSEDEELVLAVLESYWPGICERTHHHRQFNSPTETIWLPIALPHWLQQHSRPFIYLVDRYRHLSENVAWFRARRHIVEEELVLDLAGSIMTVSELLNGARQA